MTSSSSIKVVIPTRAKPMSVLFTVVFPNAWHRYLKGTQWMLHAWINGVPSCINVRFGLTAHPSSRGYNQHANFSSYPLGFNCIFITSIHVSPSFKVKENHHRFLVLKRTWVFVFFFFSWFTMLCQSLLYSEVTQLDTYRHSYILFHYGLSWDIQYSSQYYTLEPCFFIHFKCNILHLPVPNYQSVSLPFLLLLGHRKSILCICESVSVL